MIFLYGQLIDNVLFVILDPKDSQMDYRNLLKHRFYILMNHIHCNSKALTLSVYLTQTEHQYKTCKFITYCTYWSVIIFFILLMGIFGNFYRDHKKNEKDDEDIDWGSLKPGRVPTIHLFLSSA